MEQQENIQDAGAVVSDALNKIAHLKDGAEMQDNSQVVEGSSGLTEDQLLAQKQQIEKSKKVALAMQEKEQLKVAEQEENKGKYWKEKKKKYKVLAENEKIKAENDHLRNLLGESVNAGAYQYSKNAYQDLDNAKKLRKQCLESGDVEAFMESEDVLEKARDAVKDLEKWETSQNTRTAMDSMQSDSRVNENIQRELASDWLETHPEIDPNSMYYSPQLASYMSNYIGELDNNLLHSGNANQKFSEAYFSQLDNALAGVKNEIVSNQYREVSQRQQQMQQPAVASVRKSYGNSNMSGQARSRITLTGEERIMAENAGISPEMWLKEKIKLKQVRG